MKSRHYLIEKMTDILRILATGSGDARFRIISAAGVIARLEPEDFPKEFQKDWAWIMREITKRGPLGHNAWRGSIENTMRRARKETAAKIATRLWDLYWALSENTQYR